MPALIVHFPGDHCLGLHHRDVHLGQDDVPCDGSAVTRVTALSSLRDEMDGAI